MVATPSPDNYQLGKGVIFFNEKVDGVFQGERDLGNAPNFTFNMSLEKLEHFSSRGGLKAKDKSIISQITPACSFTLEEINADNFALLSMANSTAGSQTEGYVEAASYTAPINLDRTIDLAHRNIGATKLIHGAVTPGNFAVGDTITGGTSSQTGICSYVGSGYIYVVGSNGNADGPSGWDEPAETISNGTDSAALTAIGEFVVGGPIYVTGPSATPEYASGTDYEFSTAAGMGRAGRIKLLSGGTLAASGGIEVTYDYDAATWNTLTAFTKTTIEGTLRFLSDNPVGGNQELQIWKVSLTPDGDTAMIGDDWSTLSFTGEILKVEGTSWDSVDHSSNPYMEIIIE